jgi:hypothetical protein
MRLGEKRFRALQTDSTTPSITRHGPRNGGVTDLTICTSSSIRTVTVGSGIAPDLLTPRTRRDIRHATQLRALAGSPAFAGLPPVGNFAPP